MQTIFGRDVISSRSPPKHPITLAQTVLAHRNSPNFKGGSAAAVPGAVSINPREFGNALVGRRQGWPTPVVVDIAADWFVDARSVADWEALFAVMAIGSTDGAGAVRHAMQRRRLVASVRGSQVAGWQRRLRSGSGNISTRAIHRSSLDAGAGIIPRTGANTCPINSMGAKRLSSAE